MARSSSRRTTWLVRDGDEYQEHSQYWRACAAADEVACRRCIAVAVESRVALRCRYVAQPRSPEPVLRVWRRGRARPSPAVCMRWVRFSP